MAVQAVAGLKVDEAFVYLFIYFGGFRTDFNGPPEFTKNIGRPQQGQDVFLANRKVT